MIKKADPDYPIHDLLATRWSPYGLMVHQMIGIHPEKIRDTFNVPKGPIGISGLRMKRTDKPFERSAAREPES